MQPALPSYPATFEVDTPDELARWRPFVHWLLAIPHFFVLYVLSAVGSACSFIGWFVIVFTGNLWEGLANVQCLVLRYTQRVSSYVLFLREDYPPFGFDATAADPGDDPSVRVDVRPQLTDRNRVTVFFRWILIIPHAIVLGLLGIGAFFAVLVAAVSVLVTGRWPEGIREFVVGLLRWSTRVNAYQYLLVDDYPPFSLS